MPVLFSIILSTLAFSQNLPKTDHGTLAYCMSRMNNPLVSDRIVVLNSNNYDSAIIYSVAEGYKGKTGIWVLKNGYPIFYQQKFDTKEFEVGRQNFRTFKLKPDGGIVSVIKNGEKFNIRNEAPNIPEKEKANLPVVKEFEIPLKTASNEAFGRLAKTFFETFDKKFMRTQGVSLDRNDLENLGQCRDSFQDPKIKKLVSEVISSHQRPATVDPDPTGAGDI